MPRFPRRGLLQIIASSGLLACLALAAGAARAPQAAHLKIGARAGRKIPAHFTGFSIEVFSAAHRYIGPAGNLNLGFLRLMRNLGQGTLRIGGNSSDESCWQPRRAPRPRGCHYDITRAAVRGWAQASARTGWGVIVGLNLAQNAPAWMETYARAVAAIMRSTPRSRWLGFEIGNEPDIFSRHRLYDHVNARSRNYSLADYEKDYRAYASALRSNPATAQVPLYGPAFCCGWLAHGLAGFLGRVGHKNLNVVTVHSYEMTHCGGHHPTIRQLLSPRRLAAMGNRFSQEVQVAHAAGFPIQMGETNSISCQGENGVTNAFAETVWGLHWLFLNARAGMRALNFHEGGNYRGRGYFYDAVLVHLRHKTRGVSRRARVYRNQVWPLYYAMYAFARHAQGRALLSARFAAGAGLTAYAVRGRHATTVFLLPGRRAQAAHVVIPAPASHPARILYIRAASLASRQVTYGGARFTSAGRLTHAPRWHAVRANYGQYRFTLPAAAVGIFTVPNK